MSSASLHLPEAESHVSTCVCDKNLRIFWKIFLTPAERLPLVNTAHAPTDRNQIREAHERAERLSPRSSVRA